MADLTEYKVECVVCGRILIVPQINSLLPNHPEKGKVVRPGVPYPLPRLRSDGPVRGYTAGHLTTPRCAAFCNSPRSYCILLA